jgi:penicillin-binding protein 1A
MSEFDRTSTIPADPAESNGSNVVPFPGTPPQRPSRRFPLWRRRKEPKRFRIRKLRMLVVLFGLGVLAVVSALFGMFMAVASDLPPINGFERPARPSKLLDSRGVEIGTLTGNQRRIYLSETQIAPVMKHAFVAIEDRGF